MQPAPVYTDDESPYDFKADVPAQAAPPPELTPSKPLSFTDDFINRPLDIVQKFDLFMKIHLGVAAGISTLAFLIWHYTAQDPSSLWWWIYPAFFFTFTLTAHIYYTSGEHMRGVVVLAIEINLMLFIVDGITSPGFPNWFFYPWGITAMVGAGIYFVKFTDEPRVTVAYYEWLIINVILFLAWLSQTKRGFPWFFIVLTLSAIPLIILYMREVYNEFRWSLYVIVTLMMLNVMTFLIWGFVLSGFPWFLIVWGGLGGISVFLWFRFKGDSGYDVVNVSGAPRPGSIPAASVHSPAAGPNQYDQL
jgi:hypothetical protein